MERKKNLSKKKLIRYGLTLLMVVLLSQVRIFFVQIDSDGSRFQEVDQTNLEVYENSNYFGLKVSQVEDDLREVSPYINSVQALKVFPFKLAVEITHHQPLFNYKSSGRCKLYSSYEEIIIDSENCEPIKLPEVTVQQSNITDDINISNATKIIKVFESEDIEVDTVMITNEEINVISSQAQYVFSNLQEIDEQLKRLIVVLDEVERNSIEYVEFDLRYKKPVVRN